MTDQTVEVNFDGLIGPTHNYAGLAIGNIASQSHAQQVSNPRLAALQGLAKMGFVRQFGVAQAIVPPHQRPFIPLLKQHGFEGTNTQIVEKAYKSNRELLIASMSAASMWSANAATISPSADTADGKLHITPANLVTHQHRAIEAEQTATIFRKIFPNEKHFQIHDPLADALPDEGAANHTQLTSRIGQQGIEIFTFGKSSNPDGVSPEKYPARQIEDASRKLAANHQLNPEQVFFAQQNPQAIDAGVFHNDVISVGHENLLIVHELAYVNQTQLLQDIQAKYQKLTGQPLYVVAVPEKQIPLAVAVETYLFNSQIVTQSDGEMVFIAPIECKNNPITAEWCDALLKSDNPIAGVYFVDVRQSMHNGGGPACLRLRITLSEPEQCAIHPNIILTNQLYDILVDWINRHYRDALHPDDLADPDLMTESFHALDELTQILNLGSIYPFQF